MKFIDLFAGIGGFRLGLEKATQTYDCVWSNDFDKYAAQIYEKHYGEIDTRDITTIKEKEIPDHDLLVAGFPCQSFSVAGKQLGFNETRGTLFFDIARILKHKRPRYLLLENVKGLLSHDKGKTFQTILRVLTDLGYRVEWQVLNSKDFSVPQNRERIFIIGHLGGGSRPKVFPIEQSYEKHIKQDSQRNDLAHTIQTSDKYRGSYIKETQKLSDAMRVRSPEGLSSTLKGLGGGMGAKTGLYAVPLRYLNRNQRKYQGEYSFTVDSSNTGGIMENTKVRRLTPTECERLQGFPDGWTEELSDTQRYKTLGNAVTTTVVEAIGKRLYDDI